MDLRNQVVTLDSEILTLSGIKYRLLALFVEHAGTLDAHTNGG